MTRYELQMSAGAISGHHCIRARLDFQQDELQRRRQQEVDALQAEIERTEQLHAQVQRELQVTEHEAAALAQRMEDQRYQLQDLDIVIEGLKRRRELQEKFFQRSTPSDHQYQPAPGLTPMATPPPSMTTTTPSTTSTTSDLTDRRDDTRGVSDHHGRSRERMLSPES